MPGLTIAAELRKACRIHARLLDAFIDMTEKELHQVPPGFAEESLREALEEMRSARKQYGSMAGVVVVSNAA